MLRNEETPNAREKVEKLEKNEKKRERTQKGTHCTTIGKTKCLQRRSEP